MARIIPTGPDTFQYIDDDKEEVEIVYDFQPGQSTPEQRARDYRTEVPPSQRFGGFLQGSGNPHGGHLYTSGRDYGGGGSYYDVQQHTTGPDAFQVDSMRRGSDNAYVTHSDEGTFVNGELQYKRGGYPVTLDRSSTTPPGESVGVRLDAQGNVIPGQTVTTDARGNVTGVTRSGDYGVRPYAPGYLEGGRGAIVRDYNYVDPWTRLEPEVSLISGNEPQVSYSYGNRAGVGTQGGRGTAVRAWRQNRPEVYGEPTVSGAGVRDPGYTIYSMQPRREPEVTYVVPQQPQTQEMWVPPGPSHDPRYTIYNTAPQTLEPQVTSTLAVPAELQEWADRYGVVVDQNMLDQYNAIQAGGWR